MEALIELIDSYEGLSDERITELVSQLDWNFISTVLGFDPREEDPDSGEFDRVGRALASVNPKEGTLRRALKRGETELAEFLVCDVGDELLEAAALIVDDPRINHLVESEIPSCPRP